MARQDSGTSGAALGVIDRPRLTVLRTRLTAALGRWFAGDRSTAFARGFLPGFLFLLGPLRRARKKVDGLILSLRQMSSTERPWLL